jgi:hypothetical protein
MRALFVLAMTFFMSVDLRAGDQELVALRNLYYEAAAGKTDTESFEKFLKSSTGIKSSVIKGYQGLGLMLRAREAWNPYDKLKSFNKGKQLLDEAVKNDPSEMELRFLRFSVQNNVPSFLGYHDRMAEDKTVILTVYAYSKDADLKSRIKDYFGNSKQCSKEERERLK